LEKRKYIETKKEEYRNRKGCELEENGIKIDCVGHRCIGIYDYFRIFAPSLE